MFYAGLDLSRKRLDVHVLDDAGEAVAERAIGPDADGLRSLAHNVPDDEPALLVGANPVYARSSRLVALYVPGRAEFEGSNARQPLPEHREGDTKVFVDLFAMDREAMSRFVYSVPDAIYRTADGKKAYQLTVQRQPMVNPARLIVNVTLPEGSSMEADRAGR